MSFLSRQTRVCDETLSLAEAATSIIFVATKVLSRQTRVCDKTLSLAELPQVSFFVATTKISATNACLSRQTRVYRDKTRLLSRQNYACRDKTLVCRDNIFFAANICRDKHVTPKTNQIDVSGK